MLLVAVVNADGQPSSDIATMGYDPAGLEMQIQFTNGRIYSYQPFSEDLYMALLNAPSKGKFFAQFIKKIYPARRIDTAIQAPMPTELTTAEDVAASGSAQTILQNIEQFEGLL